MSWRAASALALALALSAAAQGAPGEAARGLKLLRQGKTTQAVEALRRAAQAEPKSAVIANDLGFALARLGQRAEAEQLLRRAIALDPRRHYAYANLASLHTAEPLDARARADLVALLESGLEAQRTSTAPPEARRAARAGLLLALADVERAAGNGSRARARVEEARRLPLTTSQERRARALVAAVDAASVREDLGEFAAWPDALPAEPERSALEQAERLLQRDPSAAAHEAERLARGAPGWRAPRWLRARALLALDKLDDAVGELATLLRLDPAHARAWRLLGETLAEHGGQFEVERADEALQRALALEPAWSELWLLRGRLLLRRGQAARAVQVLERLRLELAARAELEAPLGRELETALFLARSEAALAVRPGPRTPAEPTEAARALLRDAGDALSRGDDEPVVLELLQRALAASPTLLEAAALQTALTGASPTQTLQAIWDDGPSLLRLVELVRKVALSRALSVEPLPAQEGAAGANAGAPKTSHADAQLASLLPAWLERAADLGEPAALLARARLRAEGGEPAGALRDLASVTALGSGAQQAEARTLRRTLQAPETDLTLARLEALVAQGRAGEVVEALGRSCLSAPASLGADRLRLLGRALEQSGQFSRALECHAAALALAPHDPATLERLSRAATRAPAQALAKVSDALDRAAALGIPAGSFARARLRLQEGRDEESLADLARFVSGAAPDEPGRADALRMRDRLARDRSSVVSSARLRWALGTGLLAALVLCAAVWRWRGVPVLRALAREPALFPYVARAVAAVRHDALKHRASALSMLASAPREDVAHAVLAPRPSSQLVSEAYATLAEHASSLGVGLKPLAREPVFGALFLDLRAAERQLLRGPGRGDARIQRTASRLRAHGEALAALLQLGPRTRLDAPLVSRWLSALAAESRARGQPWCSPALELRGLELEFPVARAALEGIFQNLVRNAQTAAAQGPEPLVRVRIGEERDATGRRLLVLSVADSSATPLTQEQIAARESDRGLGLVRDAVGSWQGFLRVHPESPPLQKSVEACFP